MARHDTGILHLALAVVLGAAAAGCSSSHSPGTDDDAGTGDAAPGRCESAPPSCWLADARDCCGDVSMPGECVDGSWRCPSGMVREDECRWGGECSPWPDAGPVDSGPSDGGGGGYHWSVCSSNPECVVAPESCCGSCGAATPSDMVGVNESRLSEQRSEVCAGEGGCPACFAKQDPHLVATCEASTCRAIDLRADEATECADATDCALWVAECYRCDEVPDEEIIAVSSIERVNELLCEEGATPPPCAPTFPDHLEPDCEGGRCVVRDTRDGG